MTQAMPWVFAAIAALSVGAVVVAFWQSVRAVLGLIGTDEVAEERFADGDRDLLSRRHAVLAAIRELAFDHESGKLSDEDFREANLRLRGEAIAVMRELEAIVAPNRGRAEALFDERARLLGVESVAGAAEVTPPEKDAAAPSPEAAEPSANAEASTPSQRSCAACSTPNDSDAAFCKRCGKPLAVEARE